MAEKEIRSLSLIQWQAGKKEDRCIENCDLFKDRSSFIKKPAFREKSQYNFHEKSTDNEKYLRSSSVSSYIGKIIMGRTLWP